MLNIEVDVYDSGGNPAASGQTGSDGTYTISGLPTGTYKVGFVPGGDYVAQFYNGKATLATADTVPVTAGSTTSGIDAALAAGGQISGTVRDASTADGVLNVEVDVYDSGGNPVASGPSASDGTYTISGLPTGTYKVGFVPGGDYVAQFYNGKATLATANTVPVTAGSTTSGIDAALAAGGQISGTVRDASTRAGVLNVEVDVYDSGGNPVVSGQTASDGTYTISGLPTGSYRVWFVPFDTNHLPQFYEGKAALATADPVSVTAGSTTSGIDAALAAGGQISGTVTGASMSYGEAGVFVQAYDSRGNAVATGQTASDGTYTLFGLATGTYKVAFVPGGNHVPQFYNGKATLATADPVTVTAGSTTSGIDATFAQLPPPPASGLPPTISGVATQGQTLTESHGRWTNNPTSYVYQWENCDSSGNSCSAIAGASGQNYKLTASDVARTIRVQETAINAGGSSSPARSAATAVVQASLPPPPSSGSPPTISGVATQGQTLTESHGRWTNNPTSYVYQWENCDSSGNSCSAIAGASGQNYKLTASDVARTIRVQETAINAGGSSSPASSTQIGPIAAAGPTPAQVKAALIKALTVSGRAAKIGHVLKVGGYPVSFSAPSAGRLVISWYFLPPGAHLAQKPVLVGALRATFPRAGKVKVKVTLTSNGRKLLKDAKHLKLTGKASFGRTRGTTMTITRIIRLRR